LFFVAPDTVACSLLVIFLARFCLDYSQPTVKSYSTIHRAEAQPTIARRTKTCAIA
jgi:hypothetical protein